MPSNPRHVLSFATALLIGFASFADSVQAQGKELVIFAAASLKSALDETTANWVKKSGTPAPKISYGPSNGLAKQIEQGAPADLFLSADLDWIDYAAGRNLIKPETRIHLLANRLALIAPADSPAVVTIAAGVDLAPALGVGRLAMADVDAVPAGKYGKAALEKLDVWTSVAPHVAEADNVRGALAFVARGEAPFGIVYGTDAKAEPGVRVVGTFPADSHAPIVYPLARIRASTNPEAQRLLDFLVSPEAKAIFEAAGFTVLAGQG